MNHLRKEFLITSLNLIALPDKWQDVLRGPVDIGHQGVAAVWWESAVLISPNQIRLPGRQSN